MRCRTCPTVLVQQRVWDRLTSRERKIRLSEGENLLQGRGLCRRCYLRAWRLAKRRNVTMDAVT